MERKNVIHVTATDANRDRQSLRSQSIKLGAK